MKISASILSTALMAFSANAYECELPDGTSKFSLVTKGHAEIAAHNIYSGIAVGTTLTDLFPQSSIVVSSNTNNLSFVNTFVSPYSINFNRGVAKGADLSEAIDFHHFKWLAQHIQSSTSGNYKVIVLTSGGTFDTYDFNPGGQGEDNGKTLVVFNTSDDVILTKTSDGRQFGPSVMAPFSHVDLRGDAGFIDGFVVAKSFTSTGPNANQLQMHGDTYTGPITCRSGIGNDATPEEEPPQSPPPRPQCLQGEKPIRIDWNSFADGSPTEAGLFVSDEWQNLGFFRIQAFASRYLAGEPDRSRNVARLFDTQNPIGDEDLGAPNVNCDVCNDQGFIDAGLRCTGRGRDNNLAAQSNCFFQGNVLIIDENGSSVPSDNANGGVIEIKIEYPITRILATEVMDIEQGKGNSAALYDAAGNKFQYVPINGLGDNTCQNVLFTSSASDPVVSTFQLNLMKSGSINNIVFCVDEAYATGGRNLGAEEDGDGLVETVSGGSLRGGSS